MLTHLSLFTGLGGLDIAAEMAGWTTVGQCEKADYPHQLLNERFPSIPRWRDVSDITTESFIKITGLRTVMLVSGGYPCQPESTAGKRKGKDDDRWLWPEMFRIVKELRPTWVIGENVAGHITMGLETVCADLESENYEVRAFVIPACGIGAPHKRSRVFTVGHSNSKGRTWANDIQESTLPSESSKNVAYSKSEGNRGLSIFTGQSRKSGTNLDRRGENVADALCKYGNNAGYGASEICREQHKQAQISRPAFGNIESGMGGIPNGFPDWLEQNRWPAAMGEDQFLWEPSRIATGIKDKGKRLRAIGNAVVWLQAYPIFKFISDIENGTVS